MNFQINFGSSLINTKKEHSRKYCNISSTLSSMQCANEHDIVTVRKGVVQGSLQLPVGIVDQDQDSRSNGVVLDE